ncbi:MAG: ATP-binding protein [Candidatus Hydrogenedentes bacterium]|nr:ATP-binding protein [Candidatus Hydrogenedentota bacterium]
MAKLKPWYKVVTPREDLREGRPLDASEFAVHLDHIREGQAHADYQDPVRFFQRTFLTKNLLAVTAEVQRRLSGITTEASAVYNMTTQFGGGKTHALALLYHLAKVGGAAKSFAGVPAILQKAGVGDVPEAHVGIFVGTRFSLLKGIGGDDGTPKRKTPWGELAWQLGGKDSYEAIREYDEQGIAPSGSDIRAMIPKDKPSLLLIDEVMNYICGERKTKRAGEMYRFLMNLSEEITGINRAVAVVSIPASELEMTADDEADYSRLKKMLDRKGKPVIMSAENEMAEIIRRRLFEWDMRAITADGRVMLNQDAVAACKEYADWVQDHRNQIPSWFTDHALDAFQATYPFHPMVISVFERKWRELPRFQQTRGVLRLLALWVSHAFQSGFKGAQDELLITLGTAPLEDSQFRTAAFEQLGQDRLEGAVTTDIGGKKEAHALRLDAEAEETLRKAQVHRKTATSVFFESNGGQGEKRQSATVPELRMAVAGPGIDVGNVETALEGLVDRCYYLTLDQNSYYFSLKENLNKRYADRRASVKNEDIERLVKEQVEGVFPAADGVERVFFPEKSGQIPNRPIVTLVIVAPEHALRDDANSMANMLVMTKEKGDGGRTFKSALIWIAPDSADGMREEARKLLAWEAIEAEVKPEQLDDNQRRQLAENIKRSRRDLKESAWRSYNKVMLLSKENTLKTVDLGLVTSSAAESMTKLVVSVLRQNDEIVKAVSPRFLVNNWPPAKAEWSTKDVRDAFFASPLFPRLLSGDAIKGAVARGVAEGLMAYVGKGGSGGYQPFVFKGNLPEGDVDISDEFFIITAADAERHIKPPELARIVVTPEQVQLKPGQKQTFTAKGLDQFGKDFACAAVQWTASGGTVGDDGVFQAGADEGNYLVHAALGAIKGSGAVAVLKKDGIKPPPPPPPGDKALRWSGEIPPQKWMNFYTKVLSKLVGAGGLKVSVSVQSAPEGGVSDRQAEDVKTALRGLGLNDSVDMS